MIEIEHIGGALVCRAGMGEWYNRPHDGRWDMGEDVADLPAARWHVELERAIEAQDPFPSRVVVDASRMDCLVGQDWGFLVGLSRRILPQGTKLSLVAGARIRKAVRLLDLDSFFEVFGSLADELGDR